MGHRDCGECGGDASREHRKRRLWPISGGTVAAQPERARCRGGSHTSSKLRARASDYGYEDCSLRWKAFRKLILARSSVRRRASDRFFPARFT